MGSLAPMSITVKYRCGRRLHSCGLVSFSPSFCKRGEPGLSSALSGLTMPSGAVFRQQCPLPGLDRVHHTLDSLGGFPRQHSGFLLRQQVRSYCCGRRSVPGDLTSSSASMGTVLIQYLDVWYTWHIDTHT